MNIREFQEHVRELSAKFPRKKTPDKRILYLVTELGEVVQDVLALQKAQDDEPDADHADLKERLGMEIYDLIWNAVDLANLLNIDLEAAFAKKIALNKQRQWR